MSFKITEFHEILSSGFRGVNKNTPSKNFITVSFSCILDLLDNGVIDWYMYMNYCLGKWDFV